MKRVNRAKRREIRRMLRGQPCGACGRATLDEQAHEAFLLGPAGEAIRHLVCKHCVAEGLSGPEGQRTVASRARLALAPTEGRA